MVIVQVYSLLLTGKSLKINVASKKKWSRCQQLAYSYGNMKNKPTSLYYKSKFRLYCYIIFSCIINIYFS